MPWLVLRSAANEICFCKASCNAWHRDGRYGQCMLLAKRCRLAKILYRLARYGVKSVGANVPAGVLGVDVSALARLCFLGGVHCRRPLPVLPFLTGEGLSGASSPSSACFWAMTALMRRGCATRLVASPSRASMAVGAGWLGRREGERRASAHGQTGE